MACDFEASRALPQARFRSPASPTTGLDGATSATFTASRHRIHNYCAHRGRAILFWQLVSNHFPLGFGPLPSTPASRRERERALFPTSARSTAAEHKVVNRGPEGGGMIPALNGQIGPAVGGSRSSPGIDRLMSDGEEPWGFSAISSCCL
jgi:hypothetical protein